MARPTAWRFHQRLDTIAPFQSQCIVPKVSYASSIVTNSKSTPEHLYSTQYQRALSTFRVTAGLATVIPIPNPRIVSISCVLLK